MGAAESNQRYSSYSSLRYSTPRYEVKPDSYDFWNTVKPVPQVISTVEQPLYYSQSVAYPTQSVSYSTPQLYSTQTIPLTYASQPVSQPVSISQPYVSSASLPISQPVPITPSYVSRPVSIPQPYVTSAPLAVGRAYSPAPIVYNTPVTPKPLPFRQEGETLFV